jgi:sugar lactone lactonase YvrE
MAEVTVPFHVQVLAWHPAQRQMAPVPGVVVKMKDDVVCTDPELASGTTGGDGKVRLEVRYEEGRQNRFNPYFVLSLAEGARLLPPGGIEELRLPLPASWETRHNATERARGRVDRHQQASDAFKIYYGLPATLRLDFVDFHPTRKGNPLALPERTVRVHLADYDVFIWDCFDCLNPDDPLQGKGFNPHLPAVVDVGQNNEIPYFDVWPTALHPLDSSAAGQDRALRAWIDPPGAPIGSLGGGSFAAVGPLTTDLHGFVWMADGDRVHRFYPDGTLAETIESWTAEGREDRFLGPEALAVDEERTLYVADTGHDRLLIFLLLNGRYTFAAKADLFSGGGDPLSPLPDISLNSPRALAVVPGGGTRLAVVYGRETRRVAVVEFSLIGDLVTHARGRTVGSPAELQQPSGVAADSAGRLYVSDRGRHRVTRWDEGADGSHALALTWGKADGTAGAGSGELGDPVALALDRVQRQLYVAEAGNRRVQRFDLDTADGAPRVLWAPAVDGGPALPAGLAVDPRGDVFLADGDHARVLRATPYEEDGAPLTATPRLLGEPWRSRAHLARMAAPACVLFDADGRLLVSDTGNRRVLRFLRREDGSYGPTAATATTIDLAAPTGLALAPDGDLFVAETGGNILQRLGPDLAHKGPVGRGGGNGDGQLDAPCGLAMRRVGSEEPLLLIADRDNDRVEVWQLDGTFVRRLPAATPPLSKPEDVAVDDMGIIFVADTGNRRIVSFLPLTEGGPGERFGSAITVPDPGFQLVAPSGVSLDGNDLIVTDRGAGRVLRLDRNGSLKAFWDLQPFVSQTAVLKTGEAGTVAFRGLTTVPAPDFEGRSARRATGAGVLAFTKTGEATSTDHKVPAGSLVFVTDGQTVAKGDPLLFLQWQGFEENHRLDNPELARQVLLDRPSRALVDERGLLVIADTGRDRIRLVRTRTDFTVSLFETGEGALDTLPDISFRARTKGEWGDELALEMTVGDAASSDPFTLSTRPQDDRADEFSGDRYEKRHTFDDGRWNPALHTMKVVRQLQRWLQHLTRQDEAAHRWGRGESQRLDADLVRRPRESFFSWGERMISLNSKVGGRGFDAWSDWIVAHEMAHWVMYASVPGGFPFRPPYPDHHSADLLLNRGVALLEGFAESCELFFEGGTDRIRGHRRSQLFQVFDNPDVPQTGRSLYTSLPASPGAIPPPAPEQGLRNEGYFANTLWQIHHALIEPEVLFADAPSFWHPWSSSVSSAKSALFCRLLRRPWRTLPNIPEADVTQGGSDYFLRRLLVEARALAAEDAAFAHVPQVVQTIFEINNQLTPRLTLTEAGPDGVLLAGQVSVTVGAPRQMVARVLDATGVPLTGYNLRFTLPDAAAPGLSFPDPAPVARHGLAVPPATAPIQGLHTTDAYRATDAQGLVRFTFTPPAGSAGTALLQVGYQPDFITDRTLAAPVRGDRREAVLRQLYLKRLATAGPPDSHGALVERTVTFQVGG